jgi:hypothetical protein
MQNDMRRVHWRETLQVQGRSIESAWTLFKDTLSQTIEKNVPKCGIRTQLKNPYDALYSAPYTKKTAKMERDV